MIATPNYKRPFGDFVKKAGRALQKVIEDPHENFYDLLERYLRAERNG